MNIQRRAQLVIATSAMAFALGACSQHDGTTVGQKLDGAIANTQQAASQVGQDMKTAVSDVRRGGEQAAQAVAGSATDLAITARVKTVLATDSQLSALSISVDTVNSVVSLYGPAPSAEAIERATVLARAVDGVSAVNNQLVVASNG